MNCINTDYFKPFLQAFCEKTQPLYTCGYPWGPFVPYTMPRYNDADVKIFYMGRDTYYWGQVGNQEVGHTLHPVQFNPTQFQE